MTTVASRTPMVPMGLDGVASIFLKLSWDGIGLGSDGIPWDLIGSEI